MVEPDNRESLGFGKRMSRATTACLARADSISGGLELACRAGSWAPGDCGGVQLGRAVDVVFVKQLPGHPAIDRSENRRDPRWVRAQRGRGVRHALPLAVDQLDHLPLDWIEGVEHVWERHGVDLVRSISVYATCDHSI